jgi:hypothetical protein
MNGPDEVPSMTRSEAQERALKIWKTDEGLVSIAAIAPGSSEWYIGEHSLDSNGHVTCGHADCLAKEKAVDFSRHKFVITFLAGLKTIAVLETRPDGPSPFANVTIGELSEMVPMVEQSLEKLLGYRVHIDLVP